MTTPTPMPAPEPGAHSRPRRRWIWITAAVVVLAAAAGTAYALWPSDADEAADRCRAEITSRLKAPSTAEYSGEQVSEEKGDFGTYYTVTGSVDAQNGFGAQIRSSYSCRLTLNSDGSWLVNEVTGP